MNKQCTTLIVSAIALVLLSSSCQKENLLQEPIGDTVIGEQIDTKEVNSDDIFRVTPQEAKERIEKFLNDSEFRSISKKDRKIEGIYEFSKLRGFRSNSILFQETDASFYIAQFSNKEGYALISKDKRTFPIFAVLDKGVFSAKIFRSKRKVRTLKNLLIGYKKEINDFNKKVNSDNFRSLTGNTDAIKAFLSEGFKITRRTPNRLEVNGPVYWEQKLFNPLLYLDRDGAKFRDVYPDEYKNPDSTNKVVDPRYDDYEDYDDGYYDDYYDQDYYDQDDYDNDRYDDYDDYRSARGLIKKLPLQLRTC